jgi:DNA gyrase inhibitor GyrI
MKIALIITLSIIALLVVVYAYYGGFTTINVQFDEQGGETVVYEHISGDYRQSGAVMDKIYYSLFNDYKIETFKGFGIYYDNPQQVEKSKLRSEAGSIIEESDLDKLDQLPKEFQIKRIEKKKYIVSTFPYKGKMSVMFSIMRVYPALNAFSEKQGIKGGAVMEIYDIPNKTIYYRQTIEE